MYHNKKTFVIFFSLLLCVLSARQKHTRLLEQLIRPDGTILQAFFTPYDRIQDVIVALIDHEQESISVASYVFTNHAIAQALTRAHARQVAVRVIVDHSMINNTHINHEIYELAQSIDLYIFKELDRGIMHNKFGIFERNIHDMSVVLTGSFNWTFSAQRYNFENIIVSNDPLLIAQYRAVFPLLLAQSTPASQILTPLSWPLFQFPVPHNHPKTVAHLIVSCKSLGTWLQLAQCLAILLPVATL